MGGATGHIFSDVIGNRPTPGMADRYFWATDEHILYKDTGAAWVKMLMEIDAYPPLMTDEWKKYIMVYGI